MRIRVSAIALVLSFAAPAVLTEAGLAPPLAEPLAHAQASGDQVTALARERFSEGVKAFDAGRYEDARSAFLQAYALKRSPLLLLNLGQSELKSGHPEDAGNHFQQFLREVPTASPDEKSAAEKAINEAKRKAGFVVIIVDASGADVSVDGTPVGKSPILDPVFVKPGKHTIFATAQGKSAVVSVDAKPGIATSANLTTGATSVAAAPVAPAPTPEPGPAVMPPGPATTPPVAGAPEPAPGAAPMGAGGTFNGSFGAPSYPPPSTAPDQTTTGHESFGHWYTHKPLAWVGTGVTVAGLALGIGFAAAAGSASSTADAHAQEIRDHANAQGISKPCGSTDSSGSDAAGYEHACDVLREDLSAHSTDVTMSAVGWTMFGVGAVGTAAYAIVDWYLPSKKKSTAAIAPRVEAITPVISPNARGLAIGGTF